MRKAEIFVCEGNEHVGPFCSRQDAERFLVLMELFGTNCEGITILEIERRPRSPHRVRGSHAGTYPAKLR